MGCCTSRRSGIKYVVTYSDTSVSPTEHDTADAARAAGDASGHSYTFKAVPK